jgi:hypothetical protein
VVEKTKEGLRPRRIEKEGPTGLITTTTAPKLHPENETRLLSLGVIDTPDQTRAVMRALAADDAAKINTVAYAPWHALQGWLAAGERQVVIPFAAALAGRVPPVAVRLRRDFQLLLTLIRAHALLHRATRERDDQKRIIATVADYAAVRALVETLFSDGIEATVPATVRETVAAVGEYLGSVGAGGVGEMSLTALAKAMGLDKNSAHHRARKAIERGYLVNREEKRGMPARIALADPLPEEIVILPDPEVLECSSDDGGVKEGEETEEGGESEAEQPSPFIPPNQHSNTPTPLNDPTNGRPPPPADMEVCTQCGAADPGPLLYAGMTEGGVRLHRECVRFWLREHPQPRGVIIPLVQITKVPGTLQ